MKTDVNAATAVVSAVTKLKRNAKTKHSHKLPSSDVAASGAADVSAAAAAAADGDGISMSVEPDDDGTFPDYLSPKHKQQQDKYSLRCLTSTQMQGGYLRKTPLISAAAAKGTRLSRRALNKGLHPPTANNYDKYFLPG